MPNALLPSGAPGRRRKSNSPRQPTRVRPSAPALQAPPPVERQRSPIDGWGVFATRPLPARRKIGEIQGELRRLPRARWEIADHRRIYFVELDERWALDCRKDKLFKHLNHSCRPNCYLRVSHRRIEVYTLNAIPAQTELTVDYVETPHRRGMKCQCGAPTCRGRL
ncbi:MAG: SET domain-containing protein [Verrucomicrobiales bacterium]|nr:SET domain-containing protein [Verrucomicrobiales bacterium]